MNEFELSRRLAKFYGDLIYANTINYELIEDAISSSAIFTSIIRMFQKLQYYRSINVLLNKFIESILVNEHTRSANLVKSILVNIRTYKPSKKVLKLCIKYTNLQLPIYMLYRIYGDVKYPINREKLHDDLSFVTVPQFNMELPILFMINKYLLEYIIIIKFNLNRANYSANPISTKLADKYLDEVDLVFKFKVNQIRQDMEEFTQQVSEMIHDAQTKTLPYFEINHNHTISELINSDILSKIKYR